MNLRPYQTEIVDGVRNSFASGHKSPLVILPTGGGKTKTSLEMVRQAIDNGKRVVWLTHRQELMKQTAKVAKEIGISTGVVGAGRRTSAAPFQVCMVQTLLKRS